MTGEFIQPAEAAELTGISIAALAQLRHRGQGPRFYKPTARAVLYKREEVLAWVEASVRTKTGVFA
jgi:predicted DNA-binding transcriptional regulator AlpA